MPGTPNTAGTAGTTCAPGTAGTVRYCGSDSNCWSAYCSFIHCAIMQYYCGKSSHVVV